MMASENLKYTLKNSLLKLEILDGLKNMFFDTSHIHIKSNKVSASYCKVFQHSGQKHFGGHHAPPFQRVLRQNTAAKQNLDDKCPNI